MRELELRAVKGGKQVEHLEPALATMEEKYSREKNRLGKLMSVAEELDTDLQMAVVEMKARDDWYVSHMSLFEDLNKAIKEPRKEISKYAPTITITKIDPDKIGAVVGSGGKMINKIVEDLDKPEDRITLEEKSTKGKKTSGNVPYIFNSRVVKKNLYDK